MLDVRVVLKTDDEHIIGMTYRGMRHGPKDVLDRIARGEVVKATDYYLRIAPFFETASEKYGWLNRIVGIGVGHRLPEGPVYQVFEVPWHNHDSFLTQHRQRWKTGAYSWHRVPGQIRPLGLAFNHLTEVYEFGSNPAPCACSSMFRRCGIPCWWLCCTGLHKRRKLRFGRWLVDTGRSLRLYLLLPQQQISNNPHKGFNWFLPGDIARGKGEALSIRQMIETMIIQHGIDRGRGFVTGLSAGGAMACVMLATYPEVFAAGAVIAGLPFGTATNVKEAFESMFHARARSARAWGELVRAASRHRGRWPRISVWHGGADQVVKPENADQIVKQWIDVHGLGHEPTLAETVDGYPRQVWRNASGEIMIESYTVSGMGHGTPLATGGGDQQCGAAGPYLLEVGVSSSYHIAKFFGLTGAARKATKIDNMRLLPSCSPATQKRTPAYTGIDELRAGRRSIDIGAVITKALTAAGLMKSP
jgi:feruloyl esterase